MPDTVQALLSPTEKITLEALSKAAHFNLPCPSNQEISDLVGSESVSTATRILQRLENKGLIIVERYQNARRVRIASTRRQTSDPSCKTPHWREAKSH